MSSQRPKEEDREERITMEIVVDAYGPEEQALGWYYYLEDRLRFPFTARCRARRAVSPLQVGDEVEVTDMAPETAPRGFPEHEMFVLIRWGKAPRGFPLGVPLSQLAVTRAGEQTRQAVEDWHYWVERGYEL